MGRQLKFKRGYAMTRFLSMIKEPSTWAGLSILGAMVNINPLFFTNLHGAAVGIAGIAAMYLPESK
jgi:hypothetical protein